MQTMGSMKERLDRLETTQIVLVAVIELLLRNVSQKPVVRAQLEQARSELMAQLLPNPVSESVVDLTDELFADFLKALDE